MNSKIIFQLDLTEDLETYNWLKGLMQNPIYEDEAPSEHRHREKVFKALNIVVATRNPNAGARPAPKFDYLNPALYDEDDIPF